MFRVYPLLMIEGKRSSALVEVNTWDNPVETYFELQFLFDAQSGMLQRLYDGHVRVFQRYILSYQDNGDRTKRMIVSVIRFADKRLITYYR